ncbi:MAG: hypothetical protein KBA61_06350 [Spirochaetes bacterium]|nr:hypothetical protein [Spirochaetota bacterium]
MIEKKAANIGSFLAGLIMENASPSSMLQAGEGAQRAGEGKRFMIGKNWIPAFAGMT